MRILTLDDMEVRAEQFRRWFAGHEHIHAYTAREAIEALRVSPSFDLIMLDHDLAEEHYLTLSGGLHETRQPGMPEYSPGTGMDVVDYLVLMARDGAANLPKRAIIHSFNSARAPLMRSILKDLGIISYRVPFGNNPLEFIQR